ncbi:MAG TPA: GAF domain-containing protein [Steroidobacteraceae bacterium]|nr:GAF domain-containing protein [Steroidobacteraceae bacterium]
MSATAGSSLVPPVALETVLVTRELECRPERAADFKSESAALVGLIKALKDSGATVLQEIAETALRLCKAHSAAISIAEEEHGRRICRWHAAAGRWSAFRGQSMPREASPCGTVLDHNVPLLMSYPERHFNGFFSGTGVPPLAEVLLVPFQVAGRKVGTVWVIAHDESRRFDREDLRLLASLSEFAAVAYQVVRQDAHARETLAKEVAGSHLLRGISASMVHERDVRALYEQILDAAATMMHSDFASMQMLQGEGNDLLLLAWRGFHPESARFWQRVTADSGSSCGAALRTGQRVVVADIEQSPMLAGTEDLREYRRSEIRSVQSTPLISREGQLVGILSTHWREPHEPSDDDLRLFDVLARLATNLLERMRTDQALREVNHRKDEFLAMLSHELRNPLAPLSTGLELLQRAANTPELVGSIHSMMGRQLSHLVRLVDDLLDLSRVTRGKIDLRRAPLDLRVAIEAALELVKPLIEQHQHQLRVEHAGEPLPINGDLHRLTQVLANVLSNAAKYMNARGTIRLRSQVEAGEAIVRIEDTGFGIPPAHLEQVFDMFSQVPEHHARRGAGGLGIGLALARRLIGLHGGSIAAESRGLGCGSTFTIRLPLATWTNLPNPGTSTDLAPVVIPRRVLIVDDNEDAAKTLCTALESMGNEVRVAHSAPAALASLRTFSPEILLLDIGMPNVDGYELARQLRSLPGGDRFVLAAITGWGQDSDRARAHAAGFDHHLTKPVGLQSVVTVLNAAPPDKIDSRVVVGSF